MDIRVYINNDPIFQALKVGLDREERLLNSIGLQTQRAATRRATDEVVHLNQRVSDLQRVSAEFIAAQNKAAATITGLGDEGQQAKLHELRKQLAAHQQEAPALTLTLALALALALTLARALTLTLTPTLALTLTPTLTLTLTRSS